jgi:hypothetical protein
MKHTTLKICLLLGFVFLSACGPSEEAIATMTASAWTPTPKPTMTPTPVPIDLEVNLQDNAGNPITFMAAVTVLETEEDSISTDESGKAVFTGLPDTQVTLSASAQGYTSKEETVTLERGANSYTLILDEDPIQLLPATACQPGQEIILLEDFEDGKIQGWENISRPAFDFEEIDGRGTVMVVSPAGDNVYTENKGAYKNAVFHFDMLREPGDLGISMEFLDTGYERYQAGFDSSGLNFGYQQDPDYTNLGGKRLSAPDGETWEKVSIAFFEETVDIYVDDVLIRGIDREDTIEDGGLFLSVGSSGDEKARFDNFVLCSLGEPYEPQENE